MKRFWDKVEKTKDCWNWTACKRDGYGLFRLIAGKSMVNAHRVSWEIYNGEIPKNMLVLHRCDNRLCVNPNHLFLGNLQENMNDRNKKQRQARGEKCGRATISNETALKIRNLNPFFRKAKWGELKSLSKELNVDIQTISCIWNNKTWRHL